MFRMLLLAALFSIALHAEKKAINPPEFAGAPGAAAPKFDPEKKRFATLKPEQLMDEMAKVFSDMPPEAKAAMASIKANTEFKAGGGRATIQGKDVQGTGMILLRSRVTMWMPGIAAILKQMPADKSPFGAGFDADAPFMTMNQELAEISGASIPPSVFVVPEGFQSVPASEFIREIMPKAPNAGK